MRAKLLVLLLLAACAGAACGPAFAGDEDMKLKKPKAAPKEPEPAPVPQEPEAPDLSVGEQTGPIFEPLPPEDLPPEEAPPAGRRALRPPWDPDMNLDYSELMGRVETGEAARGILPPALGFRGYLHNMIALTVGDRTPGYGALLEYNFNRLGFGVYYSFRNLHDANTYAESQSFLGIYGQYRWLPFDLSPLITAGIESVSGTPESFGGTLGFGLDWRIYSGFTVLAGYTYHSAVRRGFMGGGLGWSF